MENVHEEDREQDAATGWERCHTEIRNNLGINCGGALEIWRKMERLCC
jgi:hypothetical protein